MVAVDELEIEQLQSEVDDAEQDNAGYHINTYGADFTLELLSSKLTDGEISIPDFQRRYVWNIKKASKLIESFLLGLPVPQIFLYRNKESQELFVVDGQQRLKTINFFLNNSFEGGSFRLRGVKKQWLDKSYDELDEVDKRRFKNTILRTAIFEQLDPDDDSSVFEIFARLNTGGVTLNEQEIRNSLVRGNIAAFLDELNMDTSWRALLGKTTSDVHMRDIEMILRFFALKTSLSIYKKPMKEFLTKFMKKNANLSEEQYHQMKRDFESATRRLLEAIGPSAFKIKVGINVAVLDSLMVAVSNSSISGAELLDAYNRLVVDEEYRASVLQHTADTETVQMRMRIAKQYFAK